ncbi:hypothetical protein HanXRQr2_Chr15g0722111 [Helianthus annuus]|uniref:Uncharacterized protein n=1 Tax=Helianthus annuus TaxID=4232 RepID=A0A9K3E4S4_HELAN|nr:uncharacterized protein LOC110913057 [Helianthus annuus]KAF5767002.1 hypothetical protein HanXRQr2_Chr15g0722111 [Helianthus annuus]KAJ0833627.1 hypothetical protein HanPSC8_Chr15g0692591 [Helianthus annuus]
MDKTNHHHHHRVVVSDGWPRIRGERDGSRGEGENPVEPMQSSTAAEVPDSRRESKKFSGSDGCGGVDNRLPSPTVVGPASTAMAAVVVVVSVRVSWNGSTRLNRVNSVRVQVKKST